MNTICQIGSLQNFFGKVQTGGAPDVLEAANGIVEFPQGNIAEMPECAGFETNGDKSDRSLRFQVTGALPQTDNMGLGCFLSGKFGAGDGKGRAEVKD